MQASAATAHTSSTDVARDFSTVLVYLMRISSHDVFRVLGDLDVSLTQIKMLGHLLDEDAEDSVKDIGEAVGLSLPAASRAVENLVVRGLLERREDERDRRMKRVRATAAGREILVRVNEARVSALEEFLETFDERDRARLAAALRPLLERADVRTCRPKETT